MEKFKNVYISKANAIKNIETIKKRIPNKMLCLMVKANAYGHGLENIVKIANNYVDFYGVANVKEAIKIRKISNKKILIVGKTECFKNCLENEISLTIESMDQLEKLVMFIESNKSNHCIKIHLKINTGMNRLGFKTLEEFEKSFKICEKYGILVEGVFTHFSTLDCDNRYFEHQFRVFKKFVNKIPKRENPIIHLGGSGILNKEIDLDYSMARIGIAFYGYLEGIDTRPVLKIRSKLIKIFEVESGARIGYGNGFIAKEKMKIGIVPLGYGDGISRNLSNLGFVKIKNRKYNMIGKICMDMFFVNISGENFSEGQEVVVFDNAKKWAQILGTIPYEILTNFSLVR